MFKAIDPWLDATTLQVTYTIMADVALAGRVVASHYAEPLTRRILSATPFLSAADDASELLGSLNPGDELRMLDNSRGWAWGYGPDGQVGYVRSAALKA